MRAADRAAFVLGTWFGCGLSPAAPGTVGSIGAVPLHFLLARTSLPVHAALVVVVTAVGIWASGRVAAALEQKDPQRVVIDEVAGTLIAMGAVQDLGLAPQIAALVLFRIFDITKIGPIRAAERLPPVGFGIMADDLLAGIAAGAVARLGALSVGL